MHPEAGLRRAFFFFLLTFLSRFAILTVSSRLTPDINSIRSGDRENGCPHFFIKTLDFSQKAVYNDVGSRLVVANDYRQKGLLLFLFLDTKPPLVI